MRFFISEECITFPDSTFAEHARPSALEPFGFISDTTGSGPFLAVDKKKFLKMNEHPKTQITFFFAYLVVKFQNSVEGETLCTQP